MPALRELLVAVREVALTDAPQLSEATLQRIEAHVRARWPGVRVYIPPPGSGREHDRAEQVRKLSRHLPTGVVAERLGISYQAVRYHLQKLKKFPGSL